MLQHSIAPENRTLSLALGASLVFHGALLSIHFGLPQMLGRATEKALDVVLVNSRSKNAPQDVQARAQAHLDGGGNVDDELRAQTPLPPSLEKREGDALVEARKRVAQLEDRQRQAMAQLASQRLIRLSQNPGEGEQSRQSGEETQESTQAALQQEAVIERNFEAYNKRPRKQFIGTRVSEYRFAHYVEEWRRKVERIGNRHYPQAARGKLYGDLVATITILANGQVKDIVIDRPSDHPILNEAVLRTLRLSGPFGRFPDNIRQDTDELVISRLYRFVPGDKLGTESIRVTDSP
jgi:protein TonB